MFPDEDLDILNLGEDDLLFEVIHTKVIKKLAPSHVYIFIRTMSMGMMKTMVTMTMRR